MYQATTEAILKEMDSLEDKYLTGAQLSMQDLDHIDKMAHALKSLKTYEAMAIGCENSYDRSRDRRYERGYDRRY